MIQVTSADLKKQYELRKIIKKKREEDAKPSKEARIAFQRKPYYICGGEQNAKE